MQIHKKTIEILMGTPLFFWRHWWNPKGPPLWFVEEFYDYLQLNNVKIIEIHKETIEILRGTPLKFGRN